MMARQVIGEILGFEVQADANLPYGYWYFDYPRVKLRAGRLESVAAAVRALSVALPQTVGWDEYERLFGAMVDALCTLDAEPDASITSSEQKHFVSGEQVFEEYIPGYERPRRRPTYRWEPRESIESQVAAYVEEMHHKWVDTESDEKPEFDIEAELNEFRRLIIRALDGRFAHISNVIDQRTAIVAAWGRR